MTQTRLTLISHALCPFVQRVAILLREKQIPFEQIQIDLSDKPDWFSAISPAGKVPVLKVERHAEPAVVLFESMAICEYLEDAWPAHRLHPADPLTRARHRAWIEFSSATLMDAWGYLNASDATVASAKAADFRKKLERFEDALSDGPWFGGAAFSLIDAVTAPLFRYFDILGDDVSPEIFGGLDRVASWRRALGERPSVQTAVMLDYGDRFRLHLKDHAALLAPA